MADRAVRPPRVCVLARRFPKTSEAEVVDRFLGLLRRGWDVHVVCAASDAADWARFPGLSEEPGVRARVHVARPSGSRWLAAARVAPPLVRTFARSPRAASRYLDVVLVDPDVVHVELDAAAEHAHLKHFLGVRLVVSVGDAAALDGRAPDESVWREADGLRFSAEDLWRRAVRRGCPQNVPHEVIPPAVDTDVFRPCEHRDAAVAGTDERPLRLLSVGRLDWRKGHEYALAAVRELERRGVRCVYRIVGEGDGLEPLAFLRHAFGLVGSVELLGACDRGEVMRQMRWADALVHTAVSESFGAAVVEAQATGLPVVCSDAGDLAENVVDGETGFVVPRWSSEPAADALERLARDPELRRRTGEAGRARAIERFALSDHVAAWERLYREALASRVSVDFRAAASRVVGASHGAD